MVLAPFGSMALKRIDLTELKGELIGAIGHLLVCLFLPREAVSSPTRSIPALWYLLVLHQLGRTRDKPENGTKLLTLKKQNRTEQRGPFCLLERGGASQRSADVKGHKVAPKLPPRQPWVTRSRVSSAGCWAAAGTLPPVPSGIASSFQTWGSDPSPQTGTGTRSAFQPRMLVGLAYRTSELRTQHRLGGPSLGFPGCLPGSGGDPSPGLFGSTFPVPGRVPGLLVGKPRTGLPSSFPLCHWKEVTSFQEGPRSPSQGREPVPPPGRTAGQGWGAA